MLINGVIHLSQQFGVGKKVKDKGLAPGKKVQVQTPSWTFSFRNSFGSYGLFLKPSSPISANVVSRNKGADKKEFLEQRHKPDLDISNKNPKGELAPNKQVQ